MTETGKRFLRIAEEIAKLVTAKNEAYGNSFGVAPEILKLLYPNGITVEQYDDALTVVRVIDKLKRIATDRDALGENPWKDIMGYSLLAIANHKEQGGA